MRDTPTSQNSLHFGVAERRAALFSALKAIPVDVIVVQKATLTGSG